MPWKTNKQQEQRYDLVRALGRGQVSISELAEQFGVSRKTVYKWRRRYRAGGLRALVDRSRRPEHVPTRTARIWQQRLRRLRRRRMTWGARKLRHVLGERHGWAGLPAVVTWNRWLRRWGMVRRQRRRLKGPVVLRARLRLARYSHEVMTADFKGWYRTGDGSRVDALTVRDLFSRYGLRVVLVRDQRMATVQREFIKIFRKHGLPKRIRTDNGTPFGGGGPTGLTRLSAWWVKLGIIVEFITPGRPCENGAHEQFHRVYKAEVACPPAANRLAQQRRSDRWLRSYNEERPHEALGMKVPAECYRKSRRRFPSKLKPWRYPKGWVRRWVKGNGEIAWQGSRRFVGEAFIKDYVGLKPIRKGVWWVYFGPILIGEMHENETGNIRTARLVKNRQAG